MQIRISHDCEGIDWARVTYILETVGMTGGEPEFHQSIFESSDVVVFVFDADEVVGFGRAISDGGKNACLLDVAVLPEYQGKGIGIMIVDSILDHLKGCNVLLFANPGREAFYERFGFRKMKTGMALFVDPEAMEKRGIIE
jgi:predicted N-acetyltransferase YhbS